MQLSSLAPRVSFDAFYSVRYPYGSSYRKREGQTAACLHGDPSDTFTLHTYIFRRDKMTSFARQLSYFIVSIVFFFVNISSCDAWLSTTPTTKDPQRSVVDIHLSLSRRDDAIAGSNNKFSLRQRFDSGLSLVIGAVSASVAVAPLTFLHDTTYAQWELDTDGAAVMGGLFAVVYRYCIRTDTDNPQLNQGVVGAFTICRTLARIQVPEYCSAFPLSCGAPFGYVDWNLLQQLAWNGAESGILFAAAAMAMEAATERGFVSRFPG